MLSVLAQSLPLSLEDLSLDFSGCSNIKGTGLLDLYERVSQMGNLTKFRL
jgi:hypothetical protein